MKKKVMFKAVLIVSLVFVGIMSINAVAEEPQRQGRGPRLFGDWMLTVDYGERDMDAILSFSRGEEGELTAEWVSFWGVNKLQDVTFEDGKLSFVQVVQFGENEFRSTFKGAVEEDQLTGTLTSDRGEAEVTGKPMPRSPRAAGRWELTYKMGERDMTSTLVLKADEEGELVGEWKNGQAQSKISNLSYERNTLTFDRTTTMGERTFESTFEGTIDRQSGQLTGTMKSERGDVPVTGTRVGENLVGTWNLNLVTDRGTRQQRLVVNPDLSGLYGTIKIEEIQVDGSKMSFKMEQEFGDQTVAMDFTGTVTDSKLTGELATDNGAQKIEGTKVERRFRGTGRAPRQPNQ